MLTRRRFIGAAIGASLTAPAFAADTPARTFVAAIYAAYKGKDAKGVPLDGERAIRRHFEPTLAALIVKDRADADKRGEVGELDGDPFVDAQDWEIASFSIAVADSGPGKAVATVTFSNAGTPKTVVLDLIKIKNDWRISEITWQHDGKKETLRGLFTRTK